MPTIFSKIVRGEIPCYKIAETDNYLAFLDVFPLVRGHALVIPKKETDYLFDMEDEEFAGLQLFSKKVAGAIEKAVPCKRIGVVVIGLEVPHAHIHLIPINNVNDINFSRSKLNLPKEEMKEIAKNIRAHI